MSGRVEGDHGLVIRPVNPCAQHHAGGAYVDHEVIVGVQSHLEEVLAPARLTNGLSQLHLHSLIGNVETGVGTIPEPSGLLGSDTSHRILVFRRGAIKSERRLWHRSRLSLR